MSYLEEGWWEHWWHNHYICQDHIPSLYKDCRWPRQKSQSRCLGDKIWNKNVKIMPWFCDRKVIVLIEYYKIFRSIIMWYILIMKTFGNLFSLQTCRLARWSALQLWNIVDKFHILQEYHWACIHYLWCPIDCSDNIHCPLLEKKIVVCY